MKIVLLVLEAGLRDLTRNRWIVAYGLCFLLLAEGLFWFGGTGPQVALSLLNIVLMIVPLVALVFGTIHMYASREFVELLLAQPVPRPQLFAGLFLGLALPLSGAFAVGAGIPFAWHAGAGTGGGALLALFTAGIALSVAFSAIATWIALSTEDRLKGVGLSLGVWLASTIVYDGLVLAAAAAFADYPLEKPLLGLMLANPVDLARMLVLTQLDVSALMGYTGALFERTFGTGLGTSIAVATLTAWCAVPLALAARRFQRRDF
ncbi:MAG: ABC transporter permease subunit [Gemmatimonadetes bacterium]|nr:ABC transporter permease subunit [Gemmatimonadota bacterium]